MSEATSGFCPLEPGLPVAALRRRHDVPRSGGLTPAIPGEHSGGISRISLRSSGLLAVASSSGNVFATIDPELTSCADGARARREGPLARWRPVRSERGKQTSRIGRECEHRLILGGHEALADAPADHVAQRVKIALHVQEAARLLVNAQLGPRPLLENLFEGAG